MCPFTNQPATLKEINENSNRTTHECFHCETKITPFVNDFSYKNLTCTTCYGKDSRFDPNEFVLHSEKFRKKVTLLLTEERKNLIKYIKLNSKG